MPTQPPPRFTVSTEDWQAEAVLDGDLEARRTALTAHRPLLRRIARDLGTQLLHRDGVELWLTAPLREDGLVEVAVVAPDALLTRIGAHPTLSQALGRDIVVTPLVDTAFHAAPPAGAFRFDDLFHLHKEYFEGHCHHFALAAKLVTKLPLGVMWDDYEFADKENGIKETIHIYLRCPDGRAFDYDGLRTEPELQRAIAGDEAHETSCGTMTVADLRDTFVENGWLDKWEDEHLLQALDVIALDPVLYAAIESLAPGRLAVVRAGIARDLGVGPDLPMVEPGPRR